MKGLRFSAHQYSPCRVTRWAVLAKDTSAQFSATSPSLPTYRRSSTLTCSHVLLLGHSLKFSIQYKRRKAFPEHGNAAGLCCPSTNLPAIPTSSPPAMGNVLFFFLLLWTARRWSNEPSNRIFLKELCAACLKPSSLPAEELRGSPAVPASLTANPPQSPCFTKQRQKQWHQKLI